MSSDDAVDHFCGRIIDRRELAEDAFAEGRQYASYHGCRILFRGYLADRADLCRCLGLQNEHPSDAEILAHAFREWGRNLQAHVLGEYAVAIYDPAAKIALLTHDALGVVPMFYSTGLDSITFSTRISDLVNLAAARSLDEEFLADYLVRGTTTTSRTPYRSIRRILPGQTIWWSNGCIKEFRTWTLDDVSDLPLMSGAEYEEQLLFLLDAAVRSALDAVRPTWLALSGGLDSSTVASIAARQGAEKLAAYSVISPEWPDVDEQRWMRAVVERYGIEWHPLDVRTVLPFSRLPDTFIGEPTECVIDIELLNAQQQLISSNGARVLLTGIGGDIILGATRGEIPVHLADPLLRGRPIRAWRVMSEWKERTGSSRSTSYWALRGLGYPAVSHVLRKRRLANDNVPLPPWIRPEYARDKNLLLRETMLWGPRCKSPSRQSVSDDLWGGAGAFEPPWPTGFVARHPLLYRPLVEFMWGVPWNERLRPRCDRYLQRRTLEGILPELVRRRAGKSAGSAALVEGLRCSRDWLDYLCDAPKIAEHGIADADKWRTAVRQASVGHTHGDRHFVTGIALEVWLKNLTETRTPSAVANLG